jgi:Asp/Glu/hydantoin racemase
MQLRDRIVFVSHTPSNHYGFRNTAEYLKKFPEVDVWSADRFSSAPLFVPKSVSELDLEYAKKYGGIIGEPLFKAYCEADRVGYGAAICPSWGDGGVDDARKKLSMPVVGMSLSGYTKAVQTYGRFSLLHNHLPEMAPRNEQRLKDLGFLENLVSTEMFDIDVYQWMVEEKKPNYDELVGVAMPLVRNAAKKGARAVLFACASPDLSEFAGVLNRVTMEELGIPAQASIDTAIEVARKIISERE